MEQYGLHRNLQRKNRAVGVAGRNGGGHAGCTAVGTGYRKYAGEQPYLCNGSRDSHRERIARRGDRLHRGGNGPDKEPGRNIPPASNYRRGGCGKPVDTLTVWSTAMHKPVKNVVILPADYGQDTARRWPVVYLLHGFRGRYDTWIGKTQPGLPETASRTGEVIVCPDGGYSSWYWDSPTDPSMRYETYVAEELVSAIDSLYRTRNGRGGRAITGYSMGGHGALYLALRHPETFGACGSMSGGVELCPFPKNWDIEKRLGPYRDNPQRWEEYSVMGQLWRAVPFNDRSREVAGLPAQDPSSELQPGQLAIFIDCGTEDYFYAVNLRLHEELLYRNVPHEFIVRPGRHTHDYWRHAVEYHLLFFRDFFAREIQPQ